MAKRRAFLYTVECSDLHPTALGDAKVQATFPLVAGRSSNTLRPCPKGPSTQVQGSTRYLPYLPKTMIRIPDIETLKTLHLGTLDPQG